MYKIVIGAAAVALMAAFWTTSKRETKQPAQQLARALSPILPKEMSRGMIWESAVAQGDLLVVGLDVPISSQLDASEISKMLGASFCDRDELRRFFADGGKLRVDVSFGGGSATTGEVISSCSA